MSTISNHGVSQSSSSPFARCLVAIAALSAALAWASSSRAQGVSAPAAGSGLASSSRTRAVLTYSDVDLATVRVLMAKGIQMEDVVLGETRASSIAVPEVGHGSGVAIRPDGLVLTAHHVVDGAGALAVKVPGRAQAHPARVVYQDEDLDFALVQTSAVFDKFLPLSPEPRSLRMREPVHALGYPVDVGLAYPISSPGIIAGLLNDGLIQLAMSLNPGNSGGPVIDGQDQLVAIVVARGDPLQGVLGLGVAMPLEPVARAIREHPAMVKQKVSWTRQQAKLATMVACMAETGPVGILREASRLLRKADGLTLAELRSLAMDGDSADLKALAAAYLWDARLMLVEEAGGRFRQQDPRRKWAQDLLDGTVELCHAALRMDPHLSARSAFVGFVAGRWPLSESPDLGDWRTARRRKAVRPASPSVNGRRPSPRPPARTEVGADTSF